ncbi:MAG: hypothetical protein ABH877_03720, partial [bacterium]
MLVSQGGGDGFVPVDLRTSHHAGEVTIEMPGGVEIAEEAAEAVADPASGGSPEGPVAPREEGVDVGYAELSKRRRARAPTEPVEKHPGSVLILR